MNSWKQLVPFVLFFLILLPFKSKEESSYIPLVKRLPAQVGFQCYEGLKEAVIISQPKSRYRLWRRFLGLPEKRFDHDRYRELIDVYRQVDNPFSDLEESPEGILALGRALVLKNAEEASGIFPENQLRLNRFKEAKLESIVSRFKSRGLLEAGQIEDLTRELYLVAYGPEFKLRNIFQGSKAKEQLILRIVEEDLLNRGLLQVFKDYRISKTTPTFLQKFNNSKYGKGALAGLLNLPVFIGWPPLYLPGFKPLKLSDELIDEVLDKGLTDKVLRRIDMELGSSSVDKIRYEIVKRYYLKGIMIYISLAGLYDFYQLNKELDEEHELLVEAGEQAGQIFELTSELEAQGIDVFSDSQVASGSTFCEAIKACLKSIGLKPEEIGAEDENFLACKSITDPDNHCKTW